MLRDNRILKPLVYGAVIFITLGITIANETLSRFGMEDNYVVTFSAAFVIAAILLRKNLLVITLVLIGVIVFNLPDATLSSYGVDRDVLLALICAIILVPSVYQLIAK